MKSRDVLVNAVGVFLVFIIAGPLIGGLAFGVMLAVSQGGGDALGTAATAALLGHLGGLLPAAATGLLCAGASPWLAARRTWLIFAGVVGAVTSAGHLALFDTYPTSNPQVLDFVQIAGVGAAAALACAMICDSFRPRRRARRVRPSDSA